MSWTEKLCRDCGLIRPASAFSMDRSKKSGLATYCKECQSVRMSKYYPANAEKIRQRSRDWYHENAERSKAYVKLWTASNKERHLKRRSKRHAERIKTDPNYRLDYAMRSALQRLLKKGGASSKLPYRADQLRQRMECQFKSGMSWDNYGEWEIDHKIPMSIMMARGETRPHIINALSNLQPLWKAENRSKGARYVG